MRLYGATFPTVSSDPIEQFLVEEAILGAAWHEELAHEENERARAEARDQGRKMLEEHRG